GQRAAVVAVIATGARCARGVAAARPLEAVPVLVGAQLAITAGPRLAVAAVLRAFIAIVADYGCADLANAFDADIRTAQVDAGAIFVEQALEVRPSVGLRFGVG